MAERGVPSLLLLSLSLLGLILHVEGHINAIYVFGDSTVDVGNNNYLRRSKAKANFPHYGIDFPYSVPTGRFSNGLNAADQMAMLLGFPMSPPPYLSLTPESFTMQTFRGVNFASGGSGIHSYTGFHSVQYFAMVSVNITKLMGPVGASDFLSRCLFLISTGSNDMFEYSSMPGSRNDTMFLAGLASEYKEHLKALYNLGARKFGIVGVPPIGCCPSQRARNQTGGCYKMLNDLSGKFYLAMATVLQDLHSESPDMKYALGNSFSLIASILEKPKQPIFKELKVACCGYGKFHGEYQCNQTFPYCANRNEYLFWDWYHPTQNTSGMATKILYDGSQKFVTPINFKQLAENDC